MNWLRKTCTNGLQHEAMAFELTERIGLTSTLLSKNLNIDLLSITAQMPEERPIWQDVLGRLIKDLEPRAVK
jgi:hypothetical protein